MVSSGSPLHEQVRRALSQEIQDGRYDESGMLPAEPELCERFGVSRITVRRAVSDLEAQGMVQRRQGTGTFVTGPPQVLTTMAIGGFADLLPSSGEMSREIKRSRIEHADNAVAEQLGVEPGARTLRLERVFSLNDIPLSLDRSVYSLDRYPGFEKKINAEASTYRILREQYDVTFAEVRREVRIGYTTAETAEWLHRPEHDPLVVVEKIALDTDGVTIHISHVETVPSRVRLQSIARN